MLEHLKNLYILNSSKLNIYLMERWLSGLKRTLGKCVYEKSYRGFESHSLRHIPIESLHNSERNFLNVNRCRRCVVDSIKNGGENALKEKKQ